MHTNKFFLHGLDSSSLGTKAQYFSGNFPDIICPDFHGNLEERLAQLETLCKNAANLLLIGSSFGGLMATCFAISHPEQVKRLILLAPALNFAGFSPPARQISIPTLLIIGKDDTVTPPHLVLPLAQKTFSHLDLHLVDDDHLLRESFLSLNWPELVAKA